jgi:hypothetical protein
VRDAAGLAVVNALWLVAGYGVTGAVGWWRRGSARNAAGISYLAGVAAYGVVAQLGLVLGLSLSRAQIVVVCALLGLGVVRPLRAPRADATEPRGLGRAEWLAVAAVAGFVALLLVDLVHQPLWAYDSWTFWTPKAHALAALGGLDAGWFTAPELLNRDYPLLVPAVEAAGFRFTGYETNLLDVQSLVFFTALLVVFFQVVVPRSSRWALVVPFLLVASPSIADQLASAEADIPLAAFFACAATCAFVWHRERTTAALVLFAVFGAATAASKVEGLAFVVVLTVVVAAAEVATSSRRGAALVAAAGVAGVVAGVAPWRLWMHAHGVPNQAGAGRILDAGFLWSHAGRLPTSIAYVGARLVDPRAWLALVPLLVALLILAPRRREAAIVAALALLALATLVLAYWTTPFELHYHLTTSARRVITGPLLAVAFLAPLLHRPHAATPGTLESR